MRGDGISLDDADLLLVGGGLANGLLALRLSKTCPDLRVRLIEGADRLGGNHTWSFFATDLTADQSARIAPMVAHSWPAYSVRFPCTQRRLSTGYLTVTAERFDAVLRRALGDVVRLSTPVAAVAPGWVTLADQTVLRARAVIDGRGPTATPDLDLGFQKFVGLEVRTAVPHGLIEPIIMDATVDQLDGYRFVYSLPLDDRTLLIEDTRYADGAELDRAALRRDTLEYAAAQGWQVESVVREEDGVLPVALGGDLEAHFQRMGPTPLLGLRAGLFHPTTGYSLPDAVRMADRLAEAIARDGPEAVVEARRHALDLWRERGFYRMLNRLLFHAARPGQRYKVLERFYRLPQPLIERFYAAGSTWADQARVLVGKPPVPIGAALGALFERGRD
ncbi:MAG: lycopene beta-cyclase CrtY [Caulobacteraceae bacterium]|nr:lycopene beta-cyclase CrtY [Caulobacteraceae bacterium]